MGNRLHLKIKKDIALQIKCSDLVSDAFYNRATDDYEVHDLHGNKCIMTYYKNKIHYVYQYPHDKNEAYRHALLYDINHCMSYKLYFGIIKNQELLVCRQHSWQTQGWNIHGLANSYSEAKKILYAKWWFRQLKQK